ncbi:hypothetical protein GCM10010145_05870 [Streptomyces ruber]|uniref:Uncharacterized protein n=2 Tax=Streptomyces TaxID=1883 RepID=A0A918B9C2_9ACTN|nr:hypothetical protein GCM10010145_05870 [Streptomyces ruber]
MGRVVRRILFPAGTAGRDHRPGPRAGTTGRDHGPRAVSTGRDHGPRAVSTCGHLPGPPFPRAGRAAEGAVGQLRQAVASYPCCPVSSQVASLIAVRVRSFFASAGSAAGRPREQGYVPWSCGSVSRAGAGRVMGRTGYGTRAARRRIRVPDQWCWYATSEMPT